jgi:beta-lactamase class A
MRTRKFFVALVAALLAPIVVTDGSAHKKVGSKHDQPQPAASRVVASQSPEIQSVVDEAARVALKKFADKKLTADQLAITVIDLRDANHPAQGSFRGDERIYPASVVKLFYLVYAHRLMEDGRLKETDELKRALSDMIVFSYNDATGYVLDMLTDTTSGKELPPDEMKAWQFKRDAVNRYFASLGYANINTNQKTFCEDAYGREHFSRGEKGENRNKLTTNAVARLLSEIATGRAVTPARSSQMMTLLKRDYAGESKDPDDQAHGFTGITIKEFAGARLWSKAGWTSTTRHDAAYIELPNGARFVVVTFTENHSDDRDIIPTVARVVIEHFNGK